MRHNFTLLILVSLIANLTSADQVNLSEKATCDSGAFALARGMVGIVEGETGCGSGFVASSKDGKKHFYTNKHVVRGQKNISVKMLNGERINLGAFQYAEGLDVVRFSVDDSYKALALTDDMPSIGDKIFVVGNSTGAGVVTEDSGEVLGVGPDRIEVSAKFVPGNSGSPILNEHGNVIGIATYAAIFASQDDWRFAGTRYTDVRRFALRISNTKWVSADFQKFYDEYQNSQRQRQHEKNNGYTRTWLQCLNDKLARFMAAADKVYTAEEVFQKVKQSRNAVLRFNDAWGHEFRFDIIGNKSFLTSSGADGRFGTSDDLSITNLCAYPAEILDFATKQAILDKEALIIAKQQRQRLVSKYISDNIKQATGYELDSWYDIHRFPCCITKKLGVEYFCSRRVKTNNFRLFNELFSTYCVWLTAESNIAYGIDVWTDHPVPRDRFYGFVDFIGQMANLEVKISTNESQNVSSAIEFGDGRGLLVSHDSRGILSCHYTNISTLNQVHQGFESSDVKKLPRLDSFLGIPVDGDFEPLIPKLRKPKAHKKYAVAGYVPDKKFWGFENYEVMFSLKDGKIGLIKMSKTVKVDKKFIEEINEIMITLEKMFKRKFHIHNEMEYSDAWVMHFFKPKVDSKKELGFREYVLDKDLGLLIVRDKNSPGIVSITMVIMCHSVCNTFWEEYLNNNQVNDIFTNVDAAFR